MKSIDALAQKTDALAAKGLSRYREFELILDSLHKIEIFPDSELISALAFTLPDI